MNFKNYLILFAALTMGAIAFAGETKKIEDNSFLVEEAYNQEPGILQHIQSFQYMKDKTWGYTFTQEWPLPRQTHQFSYTLPVSRVLGPPSETGLGDLSLNYRYQLLLKEPFALAPRFSLLLPTGNYEKGLGRDAVGIQIGIPLSVEVAEKWVTHWNVGTTVTPRSREQGGARADTLGFNLGASAVFLAAQNFNMMLETVWTSVQNVVADGSTQRQSTFFLNPGVRFAINCKCGLQVVPGVAMPIGVGPSKGERGVFTYLSFEHSLWKAKE